MSKQPRGWRHRRKENNRNNNKDEVDDDLVSGYRHRQRRKRFIQRVRLAKKKLERKNFEE